MTRRVTASEVRRGFVGILENVVAGEEIEITKGGRIVARLVPAGDRRATGGQLSGIAVTALTDDDLLSTGADWVDPLPPPRSAKSGL